MIRRILLARGKGKRILRTACTEITDQGELRLLLRDLFDTLNATPKAIGLAAPQIGRGERVFVVRDGTETLAFINPIIVQSSPVSAIGEEGCLSMPGTVCRVRRSEWIRVVKQQMPGMPTVTVTATGMMARVIQHEIDHLSGILMSQREEK